MTTGQLLLGGASVDEAGWRRLLSEQADTNRLPCVMAATKDWWLDPDLDERGSYTSAVRENQLRAGLLCYDCPIISECRRRGAQEEYNVWGGLTAFQRRRLAKGLAAGRKRRSLPVATGGLGREDLRAFKSGWSCADLALRVGRPASEVLQALNAILWRAQVTWEEQHAVCGGVPSVVRAAGHVGV